MRVLGVIPARGGSKGIPRKNIRPLVGHPLIYYTIAAAKKSRRLSRVVVSTEDNEIATVSRSMGADVPFIRPARLAEDTSRSIDVAVHALTSMEALEGCQYEIFLLLQPTAPLRTADDIDATVGLLESSGADAVVSVARVDEPHPYKMLVIRGERLQPLLPERWHEANRRQDLEAVYAPNGAIYCVRRDVLLEKRSLWGKNTRPYIMPLERSVNIDHPLDFALAERLLATS